MKKLMKPYIIKQLHFYWIPHFYINLDKNSNYRVLKPIISDINEPNDTFNYLGFPLTLNNNRFGKNRSKNIPILVSEEDLNSNQQESMHISWMSVEFFKQKKLYDRHWHSLEARINSQNILFRQILNFFMKWQDSNILMIYQLFKSLINKSII